MMLTAAALAAILQSYHQPCGTRCAGALFAVQDDLPLKRDATIRREAGLKGQSGQIVGLVFLGDDHRVYEQAYRSMSWADQVALRLAIRYGNLHSSVRALETGIPDDLAIVKCDGK
ncbi:MAG TPA: hypothetical protein VFN37_00085 [Candidatus Baltobacteraceae bacterium]|nr:hypothetical protein [Candidatus Baltobacteraceae bacterium]